MTTPKPIYVWFDLEFTDLDPDRAQILQVAMLATDVDLQLLEPGDRGLNFLLQLDPAATVSDWVAEHLADLLDRCRSPEALSAQAAEARMLAYLDRVAGPRADAIDQRPVLAGNSVHNDWRLACRHYPTVMDRLHYRLLDVTTLKLHWQDWLLQPEFDKDQAQEVLAHLPFPVDALEGRPHDAFYDILASIAELNFYRKHLLTLRP